MKIVKVQTDKCPTCRQKIPRYKNNEDKFVPPNKFTLRNELSRHMQSHVYKCKDCDFKCNNARSLEVHKRAEHNFKCKKCKMTLATKESLATHTTLAHTFKCQKCGTLFEQKSLLEKHFRDSHMFKCPSCPQVEILSLLFDNTFIFLLTLYLLFC